MCGIAGIINLDNTPVSSATLAEMNNAQIHRGPDEEGIRVDGAAGLAHRRLSIIDLSGGRQPLSNEDGTVWITYNGEIYNHREIRKNLEAKGHLFKTKCDTEVIVHLYEEYGKECVLHLNGMFAFGIFDKKKQYLLLARDRLGQKPLVYFHKNSIFAFASELQSLEKHPDMPSEINPQAIHDYLTLQYIPCPSTIYREVHKLPPAHLLELKLSEGVPRLHCYWSCDYSKKCDLSYKDAKIQLRELLEDAVDKRLMSDVPLGAFLSGGIDSTIIVGLMSKISRQPVKSFTIGFEEQKYDERRYANIAALNFATEHHEKIVNPADFSVLEKLVRHYGEPYSDASMLPTFLLSRFTREHVTVALSGDGSDELFAGYYRYLVMKFAKIADLFPLSVRKPVSSILSSLLPAKTEERTFAGNIQRILQIASTTPETRYLNLISRFDEKRKKSIYGEKLAGLALCDTQQYLNTLYSNCMAEDSIEQIMETDLHSYLPGDILTKIDIASMANSLELRNPFMDYRVVEFAASLPLSYKQCGKSRKHILRDTFKDIIPQELLCRGKMGFGVPIARWFRNEWRNIIRGKLLDGRSVSTGYFNRKNIETLISEHQNLQADNSYALWALLIFELWLSNKK